MDIREFSRSYARSPLGIGSIIAAVAAGAGAGFLGAPLGFSLLVGIGTFAALLVLALGLGLGQRAAVAEGDRESGAKAASHVEAAAQARRRLSAMRLAVPELAAARDLLVLEAGNFIEACGRARTWDPEGVDAIVDSLALVDAWLREADESSVEKRFALPDATPFPDSAARTAQALRDKARLVSARRASISGEISGDDRLAIEEELK